jgi:hypothetical protein
MTTASSRFGSLNSTQDPNREDAVVIGTFEGAWPGLNVIASVGTFHPMRLDGIYTELKKKNSLGARTFKFEAIEYPLTVMEIWAKKLQRKLKPEDYERDTD